MEPYRHVAAFLKERDPDRFIADLFAPVTARRHLHALHAFDAEISRIRFVVSEPALGEIRLQWWRDAIANDAASGNPIADALLTSISELELPRDAFDKYLSARIFDFYNDPMPSLADFEGYAGETASILFLFAAIALTGGSDPGAADASGHAGVALALSEALGRFAADCARQQMFLPRDRFEAGGVAMADLFERRSEAATAQVLAGLRQVARDHLAKAQSAVARLPASVRPAYLPLALVRVDLDRLEKWASTPFEPPPPMARWRRQLAIWRAARRRLR